MGFDSNSRMIFFISHVKQLGPVVQSIISLTNSLGGQLLQCSMTLLPNTLIFFVEKK